MSPMFVGKQNINALMWMCWYDSPDAVRWAEDSEALGSVLPIVWAELNHTTSLNPASSPFLCLVCSWCDRCSIWAPELQLGSKCYCNRFLTLLVMCWLGTVELFYLISDAWWTNQVRRCPNSSTCKPRTNNCYRVGKYWNTFHRELVGSPSVEIFKNWLYTALRNLPLLILIWTGWSNMTISVTPDLIQSVISC